MIRIAIVSPFTLPFYCGNSIIAERLKTQLSGRGYNVTLFNCSTDDHGEAVAFSPDIVHCIHGVRTSQWTEKIFSKFTPPCVITLTGTDYNVLREGGTPPDQLKRNVDMASALVVFHNEAYNSLKTYFKHAEKKFYVVPQGVDITKHQHDRSTVRTKYGINTNDVVFLMVSGIRPVKNIGYAIEAFSVMKKQFPDAKLFLIGPVIDDKEGERVLGRKKKLTGFIYLGEKPNNEVRELMSAADVFLNTSFNEGMPGAVLEAMAEGLPVLATRVPGNSSLIRDGGNGFLVPLNNREELISSAIRLAADKSLRNKLGNVGRQLVASEHSVKQEIDRYERIYDVIFKKKGS
jgi:glycosyltransferase involved in cell wall biosynthesis